MLRTRLFAATALAGASLGVADVSGQVVVFSEDFEGGGVGAYVETDADGVPTDTLWHSELDCEYLTPIPPSMGFYAAAYNQGNLGIYDYATGTLANAGAIESPVIASAANASLSLSFDYAKETEGGGVGSFDQCFVEAKAESAASYGVVTQVLGNAACPSAPSTLTAVVCGVPGGPWRHRFRFDTLDENSNAYRGWYVDNVVATQNSSTAGGFTVFPVGCGGAPFSALTPAGDPVLGGTVSFTMGEAADSFLWLGLPVGIPLCPEGCRLNASLGAITFGPSFSADIPCAPVLLGVAAWVQGGNFLAPGGCTGIPFGVPFTLTDMVQIVIG
ncbi:MAG TPA: hypothetical protein VKF62_11695 [Planctomycetota bacterium]|nr:hypothetical protein [Planctomycetota bacterium]